MARSEQHWRKIETHLTEWAAELDKAKAHAEAEVFRASITSGWPRCGPRSTGA